MEKLCRACGETKPVSEFYADRSKVDGLNAYCKPCQKARVTAFYGRPSKYDAKNGMKRCQTCKFWLGVEEFSANKNRADGLNVRCRACNARIHVEWLARHPGRGAANSAKWRAENPPLAKDFVLKSKYGIPIGTYARLFEEQGGRCAICGGGTNGRGDFHVDHDHTLGRGVESVRGLLCHHCNVGIGNLKHDTSILLAAIDYLGKGGAIRRNALDPG